MAKKPSMENTNRNESPRPVLIVSASLFTFIHHHLVLDNATGKLFIHSRADHDIDVFFQ